MCRPLYREYYIIVASRAWDFGMNVLVFEISLAKANKDSEMMLGKTSRLSQYSECVKDYSVD